MGEPRFTVQVMEMGGWVRVYLAKGEPVGETARFLSLSLTDWMRAHPQLRIRHIVPITSNGDTTELHAWYDLGLFPPISPRKVQTNPIVQPNE